MKLFRFLRKKLNELDNIPKDNRTEKITKKSTLETKSKTKTKSENVDRTNWTGENFEFLITGVDEIPNEEYDRIMTPNSFEWKKVIKDEWPFYVVGEDEFSFSWEIPGIQFTFNKEVKYEKAKKIADEIIENIKSIGQKAELLTLESNKVYKF
ncbi:hypothetical protein [Aequorivita viscosa]|uniref:Uncharacterized protein n=1 Tax=Aequorivita viscosa TaxID=797419 RepID=A0A1M6PTQ2_9FLAO|nr:hypothetical protein [Aequorivita viscosa]SDX58722.1 hypothetical protein SAMN05216556_1571 [Aequorivita viscosa]SHK11374.1 hypothetical protein SAMN04487908_1601 [Aequorivita viscosa]